MSGIAGFVRLDTHAADRAVLDQMLRALPHLGRDGFSQYVQDPAAIGYCSTQTLPSAREGRQPVRDDGQDVLLVLDGRIDNREELLRHFRSCGRDRLPATDAEFALHAYQTWSTGCAAHLIGEFVLVVWDRKERRLFAATDVTGTRQLFYTRTGGVFAFASEPKALFRVPGVTKALNEAKLLDYLVADHDRDDVTTTPFSGLHALAPASCLSFQAGNSVTWRYWRPEDLEPFRERSIQAYVQPLLERIEDAIIRRTEASVPVASFLSGGLDSSTIVGIQKRLNAASTGEPVRTLSLVRSDRSRCVDSTFIAAMIAQGGLDPEIVDSAQGAAHANEFLSLIPALDDPFALLMCFPIWTALRAARQRGWAVVLEGMCADLLFFSPQRTREVVVQQRMFHAVPGLLHAYRRHGLDLPLPRIARDLVATATPRPLRRLYRRIRPHSRVSNASTEVAGNHLPRFHTELATRFSAEKRAAGQAMPRPADPYQAHASMFTGGLMSFAHGLEGGIARLAGIEERSPYSDRRVIEFALRMPIEAKIAAPWYKYLLRLGAKEMLPSEVVWRRDLGSHPGISFFEHLLQELEQTRPELLSLTQLSRTLGQWMPRTKLQELRRLRAEAPTEAGNYNLLSLAMLSHWLDTHF